MILDIFTRLQIQKSVMDEDKFNRLFTNYFISVDYSKYIKKI